jgi:hypothetical protein
MIHKKWFLLGLTLVLLFVLFLLFNLVRSYFVPLPSDVSGDWRWHQGEGFEIWLPKEWEDAGKSHTTIYSLPGIGGGSVIPVVFSALKRNEESNEWITVQSYDIAFDLYAPLVGEELARECSRNLPVSLTLDFDGIIYLDAANVIIIEEYEDRDAVAYQSAVLKRDTDKNWVRTVACVVGSDHVYLVSLDTVEAKDWTGLPTFERILISFRIPRKAG